MEDNHGQADVDGGRKDTWVVVIASTSIIAGKLRQPGKADLHLRCKAGTACEREKSATKGQAVAKGQSFLSSSFFSFSSLTRLVVGMLSFVSFSALTSSVFT